MTIANRSVKARWLSARPRIRCRESLVVGMLLTLSAWPVQEGYARIWNASVQLEQFNPSDNERLTLAFHTDAKDSLAVHVYDPDGGRIRELAALCNTDSTSCRADWDGKDDDGRVVPDEAYTFSVANDDEVYDPTTISGGIVNDIAKVQFQSDAVTYRLDSPARVLIRVGIRSGPMLRTLVDWQPRVSGAIREPWNGRDEDDLVDLRGIEGFSALVTYVTLPDATVIAYGNDKETYREYKLGRGKDTPQRPERPRGEPQGDERLRPQGLVPPAWSRAPQVTLSLPNDIATDDSGIALVQDTVRTRIDVHDGDRAALEGDQFEVIMFVNNELVAEAERGYLPLNWEWNLDRLPLGEHIITVNISSFAGQVGVASKRVRRVE